MTKKLLIAALALAGTVGFAQDTTVRRGEAENYE